ncbi:MAG: hypothetical protein ACRD3A_11665 [Terriglobales bacterium]
MAPKNKDIRERFIAKIRPFKRVEPIPRMSSVYTIFNEVLLDLRFSGLTDKNYYWFFIDTHRLEKWRGKQRFIECLVCGHEDTVVFVPDDKIFEWYDGVEPNRKGHWFMKIVPENGRLTMKVGHGRADVDTQEYLNRFDLISPIIPRPLPRIAAPTVGAETGFAEVKAAIMADDRLSGDSLHEKVIDMLAQIGDWSGYEPKKSYAVEPKSPYTIDIVWFGGEELDLAVEVHDGGNETEAKDRLRQALRFGARKVVIVSVPNAIPRLRSLCRFEADLRNWLEIWNVGRVYKMYRSGFEFFGSFRPFRRRQRSDEIPEC